MKLTRQAFLIALTMLAMIVSASAQTLRSEKDPRNTAPTVGTGGPMGGPTGLFTVYDGQTLRKGEYTFSAAFSNYDRDPGNVDIKEVPVSFQFGLSDYLEFFFNTDAFRGIKVNSPRNLSGFYMPNSKILIDGQMQTGPAIVLAPQGPGTSQYPGWAIFRPTNSQPFVPYPFIGGSTGNFGAPSTGTYTLFTGPFFGFAAGSIPTIGTPVRSGAVSLFPGMGSTYGGILPGIVLQTTNLIGSVNNTFSGTAPTVYTIAPTYLPDAPFLNRTYGTSAWSTFTAGGKWRWTKPSNPIGAGVIAYYRWYADTAEDMSGFNAMQRGAGPGGNKGDIGVVFFADARLRKWMNVSANVGLNYNASAKMDFNGNTYAMLDRPDELLAAVGFDFPVNKYFQPILELRSTQYVGGRTPNAFENSPIDGIVGFRVFPYRNVSLGGAYRYNFNSQSAKSFNYDMNSSVVVSGRVPSSITTSFRGLPPGFVPSSDAHGFIFQMSVGSRNGRKGPELNKPANVDSVSLSGREIVRGCQAGYVPREGTSCPDSTSIAVATKASDAENDVLTYNYTVSGGRIVGQGANVSWDLSGLKPGTYTITAGVDDGCGFCGKAVTETITVKDCDCVVACSCPSLDVAGGGVVEPGKPMYFTANMTGGTNASVSYNWSVTQGRIVSGQGTASITVDTTGLESTNITATVKISNPCPTLTCQTTASETGSVAKKPGPVLVDEFGALKNDDVRARVDAFIVALQNNPGNQGYIINNGDAKAVAAREKLIKNHLAFRKFPASQITMVRGAETKGDVSTKLYRVPAGVQPPTK